ncbi:MAG: right-handed parallel beta-helix repeat-containing protein [Verrucomicrobiae bacterium]|nr:right-handed parallel beta-helix repeat-containing protein [Verrucomicrobiae bacterium]
MLLLVSAITFFVAFTGRDTNPGTATQPFATVARAQQAARRAGPDARIVLRSGTYFLNDTLRFDARDSGHTYEAAPGETVVLSGGQRVTGWRKAGDIWEAPLRRDTPIRDLYVNGRRAMRARSPNTGFHTGLQSADGITITFPPGLLAQWSNLDDVELVTIVEWTTAHMPLRGATVDLEKNQIRFPRVALTFFDMDWAGHIRANAPHFMYHFENAPEMLDADGEWYFDRTRGAIRYRGPQPTEAIATRLEQLLTVDGATNLTFRDITFAHTDWRLPAEGFLPVQTGVTVGMQNEALIHDKSAPAAIRFIRAVNCRIENCRLKQLGATALSVEAGSQGNQITGNLIEDVGGNGIQLGEINSILPKPAELVKNNTIAHNTVRRCGVTLRGTAGIFVALAEGTVVAYNEVSDLPYSGITIGWRWDRQPTQAKRNRVEFNHVHHVAQLLADGGGIYTIGYQLDSVLRGNLMHDIVRQSGFAPVNGLFMDNGTSGWLIESNASYNIPEGGYRYNNTGPETGQTGPQYQPLGENFFDIGPGPDRVPPEIRQKAGPQLPGKCRD